MNQVANIEKTTLAAGGQVGAIIPRTVEEMWRVAQMVVRANMAPTSLTGSPPRNNAPDEEWERWNNKAFSAISAVMMSGAELGLPPMVSLRSFTMIGNRQALYGDGLINVVRRSGKAAYIRSGYDAEKELGWCEAKRSDTGEESRVEFTKAEAVQAGLWDDKPTRRGKIWENGQQVWSDKVPNDSPWFRYRPRMMKWRASGYCLRDLFADVLGGMPTDDEAHEIARYEEPDNSPPPAAAKTLTPPPPPPASSSTQAPPPPPAVNSEPTPTSEDDEQAAAPESEDEPEEIDLEEVDTGEVLLRGEQWANNCQNADDLDAWLDEFEPLYPLMGDDLDTLKGLFEAARVRIEGPNVMGA